MTPVAPPPAGSRSGLQVARGAVQLFLGEAVAVPTGLILVAYLTRSLGPAGYGIFALAASIITGIEWIVGITLSRAAIRLLAGAADWQSMASSLWWTQLALGAAAMVATCAGAYPLAALMSAPALAPYLLAFSFELPLFGAYAAYRNVLAGIGRFDGRARASAGRWLARLALTVVFVEAGLTVFGAIAGSVAATLVGMLIARAAAGLGIGRPRLLPTRLLWSHAVPLFLLVISLRLFDKLGLFALGTLGASATELGLYAAALTFAAAPAFFATTFGPVVLAEQSRAWGAGDAARARDTGRHGLRTAFALLPFVALAAGAAGEIVTLIFGAPYRDAAPLAALLGLAGAAVAIIQTATAILAAADRQVEALHLTWPLLPVTLLGYGMLVPLAGPWAAAAVTCGSALAGAAGTLWAVHRLAGVPLPFASIGRMILLGIAAYAAAGVWPTPGLLLLAKLGLIGAAIVGAGRVLGEIGEAERALVRSLVRRRPAPPDSLS